IARAFHGYFEVRGRAHRLARNAARSDQAHRARELLPESDGARLSAGHALTKSDGVALQRRAYEIVLDATFDSGLVTPWLFTAVTAKYQVPLVRFSIT